MSYILDALTKSEQDRERELTPTLKTVHGTASTGRRLSGVGYLVAGIVLVGGVLGVYYLLPPQPDATREQDTAATSSAEVVDEAPTAPQPAAAAQPAPATLAGDTADFELITPPTFDDPLPGDQMDSTLQVDAPPSIYAMPLSLQQRLPELAFSSHIFSASDPGMRSVNINGTIWREGERLTADLRLLEITEEGIVLEFDGRAFSMSVLKEWTR